MLFGVPVNAMLSTERTLHLLFRTLVSYFLSCSSFQELDSELGEYAAYNGRLPCLKYLASVGMWLTWERSFSCCYCYFYYRLCLNLCLHYYGCCVMKWYRSVGHLAETCGLCLDIGNSNTDVRPDQYFPLPSLHLRTSC
jgi:hypothetical protein